MENDSENKSKEFTEAKRIVKQRIERSVELNSRRITEAHYSGSPYISIRFGGMLSGKTEGTIRDIISVEEMGFPTRVFKIDGDNRYVREESEVGSKSGLKVKAFRVESIRSVTELIRKGDISRGDVIGLVELPFMCRSIEEYNEFEEHIRRSGVIVIADGLGFWFNTQPLRVVERVLETADKAFYMQAWNSFNPNTLAEATLRCVRIAMVNGKVYIFDEDALHYKSLSDSELLEFMTIFKNSGFCRDGLTLHQAIIQSGYGHKHLLPSHPNDPLFAIGGPERYIPISIRDMKSLYSIMRIQIDIIDPNDFKSRYSNVHDWNWENLVL